jgi:hypothetical protein
MFCFSHRLLVVLAPAIDADIAHHQPGATYLAMKSAERLDETVSAVRDTDQDVPPEAVALDMPSHSQEVSAVAPTASNKPTSPYLEPPLSLRRCDAAVYAHVNVLLRIVMLMRILSVCVCVCVCDLQGAVARHVWSSRR